MREKSAKIGEKASRGVTIESRLTDLTVVGTRSFSLLETIGRVGRGIQAVK